MLNVSTTQNQTSILEAELNLILTDNNLLENKSVEDIIKVVLKTIEEINHSYNETLLVSLKKLVYLSNDASDSQAEKWRDITRPIVACFSLPHCFSLLNGEDSLQPKIDDHFEKIKLAGIENDLLETDWVESVNNIASALQSVYHPGITSEAIEQFKKDMFAKDGFSLINLQNSIKANFAVGHLGITRTQLDIDLIGNLIETKYPNNTEAEINVEGYDGQMFAYLYNPSAISYRHIKLFKNTYNKTSLKFLKTEKGNIPIVKIPSFSFRKGSFVEEIKSVTKIIGKNYKHIIVDLRGNRGGNMSAMYYFLSLFLGNNDPDVYPISIDAKFYKELQCPAVKLEQAINDIPISPFYEFVTFDHKLVKIKKKVSENLLFEKMIVLVNDKTFSGGEIAAATLKNTFGSKVCILGKPGRGSFEQAGGQLTIPNKFLLNLPHEGIVFYSKKLHKLLTGQRLLPDILHENKETIVDTALDIFTGAMSWSDVPSYEPMTKNRNDKND